MWPKLRKLASLKNVTCFLVLCFVVFVLYEFNPTASPLSQKNDRYEMQSLREHTHLCHKGRREGFEKVQSDLKSYVSSRTRQHALVFLLDGTSANGKSILHMLQSLRFKYHTQVGSVRNLPALIDNDKGRYSAIIFEDADIYVQLNQWNREILDKYCLEYDVGIIMFVPSLRKKSPRQLINQQIGNFPLTFSTNMPMMDSEINPQSNILRVARAGEVLKGYHDDRWTIFNANHSTYEAVSTASLYEPGLSSKHVKNAEKRRGRKKRDAVGIPGYGLFKDAKSEAQTDVDDMKEMMENSRCMTVVHDRGLYDQIERVIFGHNLDFWMHKILFMDALSYLSHGKLSLPLDRYIQVDIDDIFVGEKGIRMVPDDVKELVKFQKQMRTRVPGFNFLLGFSGKFIYKGKPAEKEGDAMFLKEKDNFMWFPHMWSHMQAHWFDNKTHLCEYMAPNRQFAERHGFNVSNRYAVAPHHAGVFPVHQQLYDCWKEIWNIDTTSTEEYPNLRPDHKRRGFVHSGIKVLPRQTCGLFTHTNYLEKYPGGRSKLEEMIHGGSLFQTFLLNQYNIFMTHFSNYGNDRLALYVFDQAIEFVQCWTNLRVKQVPPSELADRYFNDYPDEVDPVWTNPCADQRHLEIWSKSKTCDFLPKFVIVGPQKTGTTALHWFLLMNPDLATSKASSESYEEVQFFNGQNYLKGLDWYMDFFVQPDRDTELVLFEKTANYFDQEIVPRRLSALLPKANIVVLLVDPAKRAYSWYQHMRSHDDPTALKYSFYEVIKARRKSSPNTLMQLQTRCLQPGRYAEHIDHWLEYLSPKQIIVEDGDLLVKDPVTVLHRLQKALDLPKVFNYSEVIRFDEKKGFFCQVSDTGSAKCLGKGKGRQYPEMSEKSRLFLKDYYEESNKRLLQILKDLHGPVPLWLHTNHETGS